VAQQTKVDVGILTVLAVELEAVQRALSIEPTNRTRVGQSIYYETGIYSDVIKQGLRVAVGCIGMAGQVEATRMATELIQEFDPAAVILVGICAGLKGAMRIGDVIVPRTVVDLTMNVAGATETSERPRTFDLRYSMRQMLVGFRLDEGAFYRTCAELFGPRIVLHSEDDAEVTYEPRVHDNLLVTSNTLFRGDGTLEQLAKRHQGLRAAEMEAGGFIKACEAGVVRPWLVVRGVSDFGETAKNDKFHRLGSCAAASWLRNFLTTGFDICALGRGRLDDPNRGGPAVNSGGSQPSPAASSGTLTPLATNLINAQIDRLAAALTASRAEELEKIRTDWRIGRKADALSRLRALRTQPDWPVVAPEVQARFIRFEASLVLAIERNTDMARRLAVEAAAIEPGANMEAISALIAHREGGAVKALGQLIHPTTRDGWNVRLGLLVESGKWSEVLEEFDCPPEGVAPDAESRRLRAVALLFQNRVAESRGEIATALKEQPQWFHVRFIGAVVDYFSAFSGGIAANVQKGWPFPMSFALIRSDKEILSRLRLASETLADLLKNGDLDEEMRRTLEIWHLACLGIDAERANEAQRCCADLLRKRPTDALVLAWAADRGYVSNMDENINALFEELLPKR
jgi:nucleoside phosphorylase